jgi:hypothetical protein
MNKYKNDAFLFPIIEANSHIWILFIEMVRHKKEVVRISPTIKRLCEIKPALALMA